MSLIRQCVNVKGPKKTVIVFDGGGVRGRFALELCCQLAHSQPIPLSKLFSMVVGVSAGAMIGTIVALGWLDDMQKTSRACDQFYTYLPEMFFNPRVPLLHPKYDGVGKTAALYKILGDRTFADIITPLVIVCCDLDGAPIVFRSWEQSVQNIRLVDALDASSAAPVFFPPVFVNDQWLCDGGIRANKPLIVALLIAIDFFDQGNICWLSIGTSMTHFNSLLPFTSLQAAAMGVVSWLKRGLISILLGAGDDTPEKLMRSLFADRFLRIECQCETIKLDDVDYQHQLKLNKAAKLVWEQQSSAILLFVQPNLQDI